MFRNAIRVVSVAALLVAAPAFAAAKPITGKWVTEDRDAVVTIAKCGSSYCGKITRFLITPPDGVNQRDTANPDPKKRNRKLLGMPVLFNFTDGGRDWRGRIYDPKGGKDYRSVVRLKDSSTLQVKGCLGPFCQTQTWKRAR